MKSINPLGLFDEHFLLVRLTKIKDKLVKLEAHKLFSIIDSVVIKLK